MVMKQYLHHHPRKVKTIKIKLRDDLENEYHSRRTIGEALHEPNQQVTYVQLVS